MESWNKLLLGPQTSILDTLKKISEGSAQIALVVDEFNKLLGTVTDGDIRRGILDGYTLQDPVKNVMNPNPIKLIDNGDDKERLISIMVKNGIHQIPIIDLMGKVVGLQTIDELLKPTIKDNLVVIMSGGTGKRLRPLTNDTPKPMLSLGGKPLLEVNIEKLRSQGFKRFCFTVGYKAEIIKEYFGDGSNWDVSIQYIHEEIPLGTAGALRYLDTTENLPVIVMNGDLITTAKFDYLLDFHARNHADCTVCIRHFDYELPYGVIEIENQKILSIREKPSYKYFVNAGMYVFQPGLFCYIPQAEYYQMNAFLEDVINRGYQVKGFPLMEYWSDIGQLNDYEKACKEFEEVML